MPIEFALTSRQRDVVAMMHQFAKTVVRPEALKWDREHGVPEEFLRRIVAMAQAMSGAGGGLSMGPTRPPDESREASKEQIRRSKKKRQVAPDDHPRRGGARVGRRGAASLPAGPRPRRAAGARERHAGAEEALLLDLRRHERGAALGRLRAHRAGRGQRRRGHPHELPQGRQALGPQRAQVLHHERRARVVERRLRDGRPVPRAAPGTARSWSRRARRASRSAASRTRWACAPARRRSSCSRTAACPRRTCSAARTATRRRRAS